MEKGKEQGDQSYLVSFVVERNFASDYIKEQDETTVNSQASVHQRESK